VAFMFCKSSRGRLEVSNLFCESTLRDEQMKTYNLGLNPGELRQAAKQMIWSTSRAAERARKFVLGFGHFRCKPASFV